MDREGRRRYFIFGSAILEIAAPVFKHRLDNECKKHGNGTLQAFMNRQPVIHTMFHLRHRYVWCCVDKPNCTNNSVLPLNPNQWKCLYAENPGPGSHHCHCKYTAKPIQLDDLDVTLAGLILVNCCNLSPADVDAVKTLRQYRNDYFAHNTDGTISQADYDRLWPYLTTYILQLDNSRQDEITRIKDRPLDEPLCNKYTTLLVDVHTRLDEIDTSIQGNNNLLQGNSELLQGHTTLLQGNNELLKAMNTNMQKLLFYAQRGMTCKCYQKHSNGQVIRSKKPYKLGQTNFSLHHETDLSTVFSDEEIGVIRDGVMMDDGKLVLCLGNMRRLLICNTDVSEVDSIQLQDEPRNVTAVNNSTVAFTLCGSDCIEMYDINNKHKLKSIPVPGMVCWGITTINNKLVVGGEYCLYSIDHQTGEKIQTIVTGNRYPYYLHASCDRIFYCGEYRDNKLYCYNYTKNKVTKKTLPSVPRRITSLQDGSLYVECQDGSVQHVSSDGQHYKPVTTEGLESLEDCEVISYNTKQRKLFTCTRTGTVNIYREE